MGDTSGPDGILDGLTDVFLSDHFIKRLRAAASGQNGVLLGRIVHWKGLVVDWRVRDAGSPVAEPRIDRRSMPLRVGHRFCQGNRRVHWHFDDRRQPILLSSQSCHTISAGRVHQRFKFADRQRLSTLLSFCYTSELFHFDHKRAVVCLSRLLAI